MVVRSGQDLFSRLSAGLFRGTSLVTAAGPNCKQNRSRGVRKVNDDRDEAHRRVAAEEGRCRV